MYIYHIYMLIYTCIYIHIYTYIYIYTYIHIRTYTHTQKKPVTVTNILPKKKKALHTTGETLEKCTLYVTVMAHMHMSRTHMYVPQINRTSKHDLHILWTRRAKRERETHAHCSILHCTAEYCRILQYTAFVCCAVCSNMLQCAAVCCSKIHILSKLIHHRQMQYDAYLSVD